MPPISTVPVKRIPIAAAKRIADQYGQNQVVLVTFDQKTGLTHVVTYGASKEECRQAALGGKLIQKALGWPDPRCFGPHPSTPRSTVIETVALASCLRPVQHDQLHNKKTMR